MRFSLIIVSFCLFFYSCDNCANLDCIPSTYSASFRLMSKSGDIDLVFGPGAIYNKDSIRFYRILGSDTTLLSSQLTRINTSGEDSIVVVNFFPESTADVYMRLNGSETDTLRPGYQQFNTKCCGLITQLQTIRLNNQPAIPATQGIVVLRK